LIWVIARHKQMQIGWFVHSDYASYNEYLKDDNMQTLIGVMMEAGYCVEVVESV